MLGQEFKQGLSWEANVCLVVYQIFETRMVNLLDESNLNAIYSGRAFLLQNDLKLASERAELESWNL